MIRLSCFALVCLPLCGGVIREAVCTYHPAGGASVAVAGDGLCALPTTTPEGHEIIVTAGNEAHGLGGSVYANGYTDDYGNYGASFSRVTGEEQIKTVGPVRDGWLLAMISMDGERWDAEWGAIVSIDGQSFSGGVYTLPITLGQTIDIDYAVYASTIGGYTGSSASAWIGMELMFYESDGVTPASFAVGGTHEQVHAPEPSAMLLLGSGIGVLVMARARRLFPGCRRTR